jgi:short-subunit dehydrogenase
MGASSGIGRATALAFAERGAAVVVSARNTDGLASLVNQIRMMGGEAMAVPADVTDQKQVKQVAEQAYRQYGHLDTWVHLAGVSIYAPFEETTPEEFKQVVDVNLVGQANGAWAALPFMKKSGGGTLIHVSSVEGKISLPYTSAYAASKHGVIGLIDALRLELMKEKANVHVVNVMPASINTPFFNKALTKLGVLPKGMPPIYDPDEVAQAIVEAAEHPERDVYAGGAGKLMAMNQKIAPKAMDAFLLKTAFEGQKTRQSKSSKAPNAVFEPIEGYNRVRGEFDKMGNRVTPGQGTSSPAAGGASIPWLLGVAGALIGAVYLASRNSRQQGNTPASAAGGVTPSPQRTSEYEPMRTP